MKINADKCKVDVNGTAVVEDMTTSDFNMWKRGQVVEMHTETAVNPDSHSVGGVY